MDDLNNDGGSPPREVEKALSEIKQSMEATSREAIKAARPPSLPELALDLSDKVARLVDRAGKLGGGKRVSRTPSQPKAVAQPHEATATPLQPSRPQRSKPGPKRDIETARMVANVVGEIVPDGGWKQKDNLNLICERLDAEQIPFPKTWRKREVPLDDWADAAAMEPELAKKAIDHHLKNAQT